MVLPAVPEGRRHGLGCALQLGLPHPTRLRDHTYHRPEARRLGTHSEDTRIYLNHVEPLKMQLQQGTRPFLKLKILQKVETTHDFEAEDFQIEGYNPHPTIKMEMAVSSAFKGGVRRRFSL